MPKAFYLLTGYANQLRRGALHRERGYDLALNCSPEPGELPFSRSTPVGFDDSQPWESTNDPNAGKQIHREMEDF